MLKGPFLRGFGDAASRGVRARAVDPDVRGVAAYNLHVDTPAVHLVGGFHGEVVHLLEDGFVLRGVTGVVIRGADVPELVVADAGRAVHSLGEHGVVHALGELVVHDFLGGGLRGCFVRRELGEGDDAVADRIVSANPGAIGTWAAYGVIASGVQGEEVVAGALAVICLVSGVVEWGAAPEFEELWEVIEEAYVGAEFSGGDAVGGVEE